MRDPVSFRVSGGGGGAPNAVLLWEIDHRASTVDWLEAPPATLNGLAITTSLNGTTPAVWGTDGANGLVIDDGGTDAYGRYEITAADIATYAATGSRALTRLDTVIFACEWQAATPSSNNSHQLAEIYGAIGGGNNNVLGGKAIAASVTRRLGVYNGGWQTVNSVAAVTSVISEIGVNSAHCWSTTDVLTTAELPDPTAYFGPVQVIGPLGGVGSSGFINNRSGVGTEWSISESLGTFAPSQQKKALEAATMYHVRSQIWVRPGTPYEAP